MVSKKHPNWRVVGDTRAQARARAEGRPIPSKMSGAGGKRRYLKKKKK